MYSLTSEFGTIRSERRGEGYSIVVVIELKHRFEGTPRFLVGISQAGLATGQDAGVVQVEAQFIAPNQITATAMLAGSSAAVPGRDINWAEFVYMVVGNER